MALIPVLDDVVNRLILRRSRIWQEIQFHKFRIKARPDKKSDIVESVLFDMSAINDKSASLLQHISVIMAVVALGLGSIEKNDAAVRACLSP